MTTKLCRKCVNVKEVQEFNQAKGRKDGLQPYCRECQNNGARNKYNRDLVQAREYGRTKRNKNLEKVRARDRRWYHANRVSESARKRLAKYGITPERFELMKQQQDNKCAMCKVDKPGGMGEWHVDHNHKCCPGTKSCGKCIRGLLCFRCNVEVGIIEDPVWLRNAIKYAAETRGVGSRLHQNLLESLKISESLFSKQSGDALNG